MGRSGSGKDSGTGDVTERIALRTVDGVILHAELRRHRAGPGAVVVVPGFTGDTARIRPVVRRMSGRLTVLALDLRGHGRSGGRSEVGAVEERDIAAAVEWLRTDGFTRVAVLGFSLGGAVALRAAVVTPVDAVVAVSAPSRWYLRQTSVTRRLHVLFATAAGRRLLGGLGRVRLSGDWTGLPTSPVEAAASIGVPSLVVHGDQDNYFPVEHAFALAAALGEVAELWIEPATGHAEGGVSTELLDRVTGWLVDRLTQSTGTGHPTGHGHSRGCGDSGGGPYAHPSGRIDP